MNPEQIKEVLSKHLSWRRGEGGERANLRSADLYGADLYGADLYGADLSNANLRSADLSNANLRSANLSLADLSGANLSGANLSGADLRSALTDDLFFQISRIGSENRMTTWNATKDIIWCGCFKGTMQEWIEKIQKTYEVGNKHRDAYLAAVLYFQTLAKIYGETK
jgi:uncharacterized protein YjbI with pentapeptide repeats